MVMDLIGGRFTLTPRPVGRTAPALEVAMLGHCPGFVRMERLLRLTDAIDEMRELGFGPHLDAIAKSPTPAPDHLPIPLRSAGEFVDIFPDAQSSQDTLYYSRLAGGGAWLPQAVEDFFANGGEKLWMVRIPEPEGINGFLPRPYTVLHDMDTLAGLAVVLVLPNVGLVAFPDLERLQIPAQLEDIPRVRLANPAPEFIPCSQSVEDDDRERRRSSEIIAMPEPLPLIALLRQILTPITDSRPDMQCLYTLPLAYSMESDSPAIDDMQLAALQASIKAGAPALRHVQFLFPYLRSVRYALRSPAGVIAGSVAGAARRQGVWRSIAGVPLFTDGKPYPLVSLTDTIRWRNAPGVGVLQQRKGRLELDDERLAVPALPADDYPSPSDPRFDGFRSAEVQRFIGFTLRQLQALGEDLIFDADPADPRPRLLLEKFFLQLYQRGALRGAGPEEAFVIRQRAAGENTIAYDIQIAPAFPVDHVSLTFVNRSNDWQLEVSHA